MTPFTPFEIRRRARINARQVRVLDAELRRQGKRPLRVTKDHRCPHIPLKDCVHGHVYAISSRNLIYGVFDKTTDSFTGIREKFGNEYLFAEYHWDQGPPYGTVTPTKDVGMLPKDVTTDEQIFAYLKKLEKEHYENQRNAKGDCAL